MRTKLFLTAALLGLASAARAVDQAGTLSPSWGTAPVAIIGGDSFATYSVSCSSNTLAAGATQLRPAVTVNQTTQSSGRPLRHRRFLNTSNFDGVLLGSSTVATSDFYQLGESTNSAVVPFYDTYTSGAIYCAPRTGVTAVVVKVIEEIQSVP